MLAIITIIIVIVEFFPFGFSKEKILPNTSIYTYKEDVKLNSKRGFVDFLKNNTNKYDLTAFHDSDEEIDWNAVYEAVEVSRVFWRKCYNLEYTPEYCNRYFLKVTSNGNVYDYRSCGK